MVWFFFLNFGKDPGCYNQLNHSHIHLDDDNYDILMMIFITQVHRTNRRQGEKIHSSLHCFSFYFIIIITIIILLLLLLHVVIITIIFFFIFPFIDFPPVQFSP